MPSPLPSFFAHHRNFLAPQKKVYIKGRSRSWCWWLCDDDIGSMWRCVFFHCDAGDAYDTFYREYENSSFFFRWVGGWFDVIYNIFLILFFRTLFASIFGGWKKGKILLSCVPEFSFELWICYKFFLFCFVPCASASITTKKNPSTTTTDHHKNIIFVRDEK